MKVAHAHQPVGSTISQCLLILPPRPTTKNRQQGCHPVLVRAQKHDNRTDAEDRQSHTIPVEALTAIVRATAVAALFTAVTASLPPSALASDTWRPRRHTRRMKNEILKSGARVKSALHDAAARAAAEIKRTNAAAAAAASSSQPFVSQELASIYANAQKSVKNAYKNLQKGITGGTSRSSKYSVGVSGRPDPNDYYSRSSRASPEASPLGWWVVGVAVVGIGYSVFGERVANFFKSGGRRENGRWIRDRSLGGKLVFIPDVEMEKSAPRPLWEDDDEDDEDVAAELASTAAHRSTTTPTTTTATRTRQQEEDEEPTWWAPPAPVGFVSPSRKEDLTKQAKSLLRALQDAKLRGEDYPIDSLIALRRVCHEGGGISVRASTESGRDALLRTAVTFSTEAALTQNAASYLGGYEPGRFISGLAGDLNVPVKRAVTVTHGVIAAICRAALIDAEAAFRAADQDRVLFSLGKIVAILTAFPLPSGSAEAELVGRTILAQTTLEFRRAVFLAAGSANLDIAPTIASMLGFAPAQVMEQLKTQMAVAAAAAQNAAGSGSNGGGDDTTTDN